jgi:hypothetical protein
MAVANSTRASRAISLSCLPTFVLARDQRAVAAGLIVERQEVNGFLLTSSYRGSQDAFARSGLLRSTLRIPGEHPHSATRAGLPRS